MSRIKSKKEIIIILDNIRSAHNTGSIFRTADAVGVSKIFLCGVTPLPSQLFDVGQKVGRASRRYQHIGSRAQRDIEKTALGAENFIPWEYCQSALRLVRRLKKEKVRIVALEQVKGAKKFTALRPRYPLALVLGNEVDGVSRKVLAEADDIIYIPMSGKKESLNVSVASGIALYEIIRDN